MSNQTQTYSAYVTSVSSEMNKYYLIVSSSIGIPCNLISIFIFARLIKNKTNMGFLYVCQCTVDLYLLLITLLVLRSWPLLFPYNFAIVSDDLCKLLTFLRRFSLHISSWMSVLITFDRLIFVLHEQNQKFRFMKRKTYLSLVILGMFICLAIIDIPNLFFYLSINPKTGSGSCNGSFAIVISSDIISTFLRTYIPLFLMVSFNFLMIRKIFDKRRLTYNQSLLNRKEYQFTFAVMAYSLYFFILNFPLAVFYIFYDVNSYSGALAGDFGATYNFLFNLFLNLTLLQQNLSFFMNLAFNKLFRQEVFMLVGIPLGLRRFSLVQPTSHRNRNNS